MHRRVLLSFLLGALVPAQPAGADAVVERLLDPSPIRDYAGIQVLSVYDGHVYHLAIRRASKAELVPVKTSRAQFDADIGPDEQGRPMLAKRR